MRIGNREGGRALVRRGFTTMALLALVASGSSAQLVYDGNVVFNNNASGTLAGQFTGSNGAGAPACGAPGTVTAAILGTTTYTHNTYADPLLPFAPYQANVFPSFQPNIGSPAYSNAVAVPAGGFFEQTCYAGALGNPGNDWTKGWTYWDSTGANRQDLHLAGMPNPRPLSVLSNLNVYGHVHLSPDTNYLIRGQLRVKSQATLTIPPGVVLFGEFATLGTLIVERGGKLYAIGTACDPIIFTSDDPPGSQVRGRWGGIVINGYARTSKVNSCAGDSASSEGGAVGFYGGNDDTHDAGILRYVRVEFAGKEITTNNELNSFMWNACGTETKGDYLQAYQGADDGFEWFGGSMDQKHLVAIDGTDDGYDWQMGTRNRAQFVIVRVTPVTAPSGTQFGEKGIEADNNEDNHDQVQCSGRANSVLANFTIIGDKRTGAAFPGSTTGANFRRGTGATLLNSIVYNFKTAAVGIGDDATWQAHCLAPPAAPASFCGSATANVTPITEGNVFVARSQPNPFRNQVSFTFALPKAGPVSVEIYSADGRHVKTVAKETMGAGQHSIAWTLDRDTPSGLYFYKVLAGDRQSTGKITRVD